MKKFQFKLSGFMPLLMHADDIDGADELKAWRTDPANKDLGVPGDDRSPAWTWQTYLYHADGKVVMPSENIMAALRVAGAKLQLKGKKTFKEATQSGLLMSAEHCQFTVNDQPVAMAGILALRGKVFSAHAEYARDNGFHLFVKRAKVGTAKHIRVRAKFDNWAVSGIVHATRPELTEAIVPQLFSLAGTAGLCDWRPSGKTPGPYGQFDAVVKEI